MPKPQLKHVAHSGKHSWWVGTQLLYFIFFLDASSPYLSPPNHSLHFRRYRKVNIHILLKRGDWCQEWKCASVQVTAKERALLKNIENTRYYYWCIFQEVYFERKKKNFTAIQVIATLWKYLVTVEGKKNPEAHKLLEHSKFLSHFPKNIWELNFMNKGNLYLVSIINQN